MASMLAPTTFWLVSRTAHQNAMTFSRQLDSCPMPSVMWSQQVSTRMFCRTASEGGMLRMPSARSRMFGANCSRLQELGNSGSRQLLEKWSQCSGHRPPICFGW